MKWKPIDCISLVIIIGCFILLGLGKDSVISWCLLAVVGGYYGIDLGPRLGVGQRRKPPADDVTHQPPP